MSSSFKTCILNQSMLIEVFLWLIIFVERIKLKYACIKEHRLYYHLYLYIHEYYLFLYIANCFYSMCYVNKYKQFCFCHLQVTIRSLISHNFVNMLVLFELCSSSAEFCVFTRILWSSCLVQLHKRSLFVVLNHVKLHKRKFPCLPCNVSEFLS